MSTDPVAVDVGPLSIADVVRVARDLAPVRLTDDALAAIDRARLVIDELASLPTPAYGVSTGFGALATRHIPVEMRAQLQKSLVRSHAAGSGPEVEREVVRALMLLRLSTLATGRTGVRRETAELMAALLNHQITPVVREYGSLGCSGDLAPLSHCALALMGEGEVRDATGVLMPAASALTAAGLAPVEFAAKEGLALINGTDGMLGMLAMAITDLTMLLRTADIAAAMSVEGQLGTDRVFAAELMAIRPQPGQAVSASNLRALLSGSQIMASHQTGDCNRVQDAYSLRCSPQVHGAARDTVAYAATVAGYELASAVDNPVVMGGFDPMVEEGGARLETTAPVSGGFETVVEEGGARLETTLRTGGFETLAGARSSTTEAGIEEGGALPVEGEGAVLPVVGEGAVLPVVEEGGARLETTAPVSGGFETPAGAGSSTTGSSVSGGVSVPVSGGFETPAGAGSSTTESSGASSPTGTSTAPPWRTSSTSSRSSRPTSPRSANGVRIASSTGPATTGCRPSWLTTRGSTAAT
jgi:histidine ammonia-lyase